MTKPTVYVTRRIFPEAIALLKTVAGVRQWDSDMPITYVELVKELRSADGLFSLLTDRIDAALLAQSPKLRVVGNMAVGFNNIDVPAASARGIFIGNTPGVLTETTAELAFALMISWARRIPESQQFSREGKWVAWKPMELLGVDLNGKTLGVIGMGRIGEALALRARAFGMRIVYHNRKRNMDSEKKTGATYLEMDALLAESDFVSVHVPLAPETRGIIGERELAKMKPSAVLINTARGEVVDQDALIRALQTRRIAGAALDVTTPEPLPMNSPLYHMENVVLTPHIGSATYATRLKMAMMTAQNIVDVLKGRLPTNCVNPEAAQRKKA